MGTLIFPLPAKSQTRDRLCENSFRLVGNSETNLVNVWSSPNSDSDLVKALPSGTEVLFNLSNRQGDWAEITMPGGMTGWVADRFLLPSPAGATQFNGTMRVRTLDRNIAGAYQLVSMPWIPVILWRVSPMVRSLPITNLSVISMM